jgi:hypothetical protein
MTTRRLLWLIPVAAVLLAPIILFLISRALTVYPALATETQFLQAYTPNRVLERFRDSKYSSSTGSSAGDGAGLGFATHTRGFDQQFVMRLSDRTALISALDRDVTSFLTNTGAKVISETGNVTDGLCLRYVSGKSNGTVTIEPMAQALMQGFRGWGPDEDNVLVRIRIEETWFRSGTPMTPDRMTLLSRFLM